MSKVLLERDKGMIEQKLFPSITLFVDGVYCGILTADEYELKEIYDLFVIKFYLDNKQIFQKRYKYLKINHPITESYEFNIVSYNNFKK
jgi:hypothetical protein